MKKPIESVKNFYERNKSYFKTAGIAGAMLVGAIIGSYFTMEDQFKEREPVRAVLIDQNSDGIVDYVRIHDKGGLPITLYRIGDEFKTFEEWNSWYLKKLE